MGQNFKYSIIIFLKLHFSWYIYIVLWKISFSVNYIYVYKFTLNILYSYWLSVYAAYCFYALFQKLFFFLILRIDTSWISFLIEACKYTIFTNWFHWECLIISQNVVHNKRLACVFFTEYRHNAHSLFVIYY